MKTLFKYMTYPFLAVFLFTAVPALCCCMDIAEASEPIGHHADTQAVQQRDTGHHDHASHDHHHSAPDKSSSHDHSQCEHPQIIANLTTPLNLYFGNIGSSFSKNFQEPYFIDQSVVITDDSSAPPLDLGPPGNHRISSTPLYLQISVLLI